jgi:tripartite-type tricarboxylate transporter receptor subunit TctC
MMLRFFLGIFLSLGISPTCSAQQYPSKPIKIIVPFPVGGIADIYSRLIGNRWTEAWGQPVVIESHTGAGGNIGADLVAKAAPDLPTVAETLPGFEENNWVGFFAPAGTPPDIVGRLNAETQKFMQSKEITARLTAEGARFIPMTPDQFGAFVKAEVVKWAPVVKASGAKAD